MNVLSEGAYNHLIYRMVNKGDDVAHKAARQWLDEMQITLVPKTNLNKSEMLVVMGVTWAYDVALPQPWLDKMVKDMGCNYSDTLSAYVWAYGDIKKGEPSGPYNVAINYIRFLLTPKEG